MKNVSWPRFIQNFLLPRFLLNRTSLSTMLLLRFLALLWYRRLDDMKCS